MSRVCCFSPFPISSLCTVSEIPTGETGWGQQVGKEKLYLPDFESTDFAALDCGH